MRTDEQPLLILGVQSGLRSEEQSFNFREGISMSGSDHFWDTSGRTFILHFFPWIGDKVIHNLVQNEYTCVITLETHG